MKRLSGPGPDENRSGSVFNEYGPPPVHIDGQLELGEDMASGESVDRQARPPADRPGRLVLTVQQVVAQRLKNL
jgi:hypothetical protein